MERIAKKPPTAAPTAAVRKGPTTEKNSFQCMRAPFGPEESSNRD
jgi:hypothetical protein